MTPLGTRLSGVPHTLTLTVPLVPAATARLVLVNSPTMKQTADSRAMQRTSSLACCRIWPARAARPAARQRQLGRRRTQVCAHWGSGLEVPGARVVLLVVGMLHSGHPTARPQMRRAADRWRQQPETSRNPHAHEGAGWCTAQCNAPQCCPPARTECTASGGMLESTCISAGAMISVLKTACRAAAQG
jgi:hypothetical protein